jgi:transposase-like protein
VEGDQISQHAWSERELERRAQHRIAILDHAEDVTGSVAATCCYVGISRQVFYRWKRRYEDDGLGGLRNRSSKPHRSPNAIEVHVVGESVYLRETYHVGSEKVATQLVCGCFCHRGTNSAPNPRPTTATAIARPSATTTRPAWSE